MFNPKQNNKKTILRFLFAAYLNQQLFDWLLKNRSKDWVGYLHNETVETMRIKDEPWIRKFVIIGTQDFLDAIKNRKYRKRQSKNLIPKNPYLFQILKLLKIKYDPNQRREELERIIDEEIKKLGILAKG